MSLAFGKEGRSKKVPELQGKLLQGTVVTAVTVAQMRSLGNKGEKKEEEVSSKHTAKAGALYNPAETTSLESSRLTGCGFIFKNKKRAN